jgi:hypothetical protein
MFTPLGLCWLLALVSSVAHALPWHQARLVRGHFSDAIANVVEFLG